MTGLLLSIVANVLGIILIILTTDVFIKKTESTKPPIFQANKKRKLPRKWIIIGCFVVSIIVSAYQYLLERNEELTKEANEIIATNERDSFIRSEKEKSDSIADLRGQRRTDSTVAAITEALAKYNLRFDSPTNNIVLGLRDSLKKAQNRKPDPEFSYSSRALYVTDSVGGKIGYGVSLTSKQAPARNLNLKFYVVAGVESGKFYYTGTYAPIPENHFAPTEDVQNFPLFNLLKTEIGGEKIIELFVLMKGTYTNNDGDKTFPIEQVAAYNVFTHEHGFAASFNYTKVKQVIISTGINL